MEEIPRRAIFIKMTEAEQLIVSATQAIETMGADDRLTRAQNLLAEARSLVADYVDGAPKTVV